MPTNQGAMLSLDMGERRVGVALANPIARMASPLTTLENNDQLIDAIQALIQEHAVDTVIVGLPRGLDGQETAQTQKIRAWVDDFEKQTGRSVILQDEAVTSIQAEQLLKQTKKSYSKEDIDMYAAAEILQDYLNNDLKGIHA